MEFNFLIRVLRVLKKEIKMFPQLLRCIFEKLFYNDKVILINGWLVSKNGKVLHNNWGDDINVYFLAEVTGKRIIIYPNTYLASLLNFTNYVCIGSIISFCSTKNSIVWGSGLINDVVYTKMKEKPKKILAVRGPLTRKWLLEQQIECPAVYGDPALLLPNFYTPKKVKHYKVGLIPHWKDMDNLHVKRLMRNDDVRLIHLRGYEHWKDIIDEVCSCDLVISSSLHGIIVSEAYRIPSVWVVFNENEKGWEFKYYDFYASIKKEDISYIKVDNSVELSDLISEVAKWRPGCINITSLLETCPFELHSIN